MEINATKKTMSNGRPRLSIDMRGGPQVQPAFRVEGTKAIYKVIALREYDAAGDIVAAGSETGTTEAELDAGHKFKPTWDYVRMHP